ncbi:MAG: GWxTD domain-containing protein [Rhodothermales bacterium]
MAKWYYTYKLSLLCCGLMLALAAGTVTGLHAQGVPEFEVDAISVRSDGSLLQSRLDLYTRIPYSNLTFINTPNGFTAHYEITAEIFTLDKRNRRQHLVQTRIWESAPSVDLYGHTQASQYYDPATHSVDLDPGRYLIELQLTDKHSEETFVQELPVEVRELRSTIALSDLLLLEEYDRETQTMYPRVSDRIGSDEMTFEVFYEVYADRPQRVRVTREVVSMKKQSSALIRFGKQILGIRPEEEEEAIEYTDAEMVSLQRGRHQTVTEIPISDLNGYYYVRVKLEDENGHLLDKAERMFSAQWVGLAEHLSDLDQAIAQLEYAAKSKELAAIKNASTHAERLRLFEEFWKKRDPTPGTLRNERLEEYYYRIAYANREYSSVTEGWKTDRGHVLVRFGVPDNIRRQTFDYNNEPWEVWTYERIGREFIFVDKTGFGDYELRVPIYDERTRIRR